MVLSDDLQGQNGLTQKGKHQQLSNMRALEAPKTSSRQMSRGVSILVLDSHSPWTEIDVLATYDLPLLKRMTRSLNKNERFRPTDFSGLKTCSSHCPRRQTRFFGQKCRHWLPGTASNPPWPRWTRVNVTTSATAGSPSLKQVFRLVCARRVPPNCLSKVMRYSERDARSIGRSWCARAYRTLFRIALRLRSRIGWMVSTIYVEGRIEDPTPNERTRVAGVIGILSVDKCHGRPRRRQ